MDEFVERKKVLRRRSNALPRTARSAARANEALSEHTRRGRLPQRRCRAWGAASISVLHVDDARTHIVGMGALCASSFAAAPATSSLISTRRTCLKRA